MKKYTLLSLSVAAFTACTIFELVPAEAPYESFSLVAGDTVKTRVDKVNKIKKDNNFNNSNYIVVGEQVITYKEPKLHTPPAKDPDISQIKNNDDPDLKGRPLRMVATGGSLTAGVRDGGYFNEGIMTSYPNLIARQMKLKKFEQPLFDAADYNGFDRKVKTNFNPTGGPVPKFNQISNNSAIDFSNGKAKLKKFQNNNNLDNFSIPYPSGNIAKPSVTSKSMLDYDFANKYPLSYATLERITNNNESIFDKLFDKKFDLIIVEAGLDELWNEIFNAFLTDGKLYTKDYIFNNLDLKITKKSSYEAWGFDISSTFIIAMEANRQKVKFGCILNSPEILKLPYFTFIPRKSVDDVIKMAGQFPDNYEINYLPSPTIDSMISPKVHISIKPGIRNSQSLSKFYDFISPDKLKYIRDLNVIYNNEKLQISKKFGYPVVDIKTLYDTILKGNFTTSDGVKVDPSYPNGNFFSLDGINPTAFGQAIIANEVIKVLNTTYKTDIPMIATREYLLVK